MTHFYAAILNPRLTAAGPLTFEPAPVARYALVGRGAVPVVPADALTVGDILVTRYGVREFVERIVPTGAQSLTIWVVDQYGVSRRFLSRRATLRPIVARVDSADARPVPAAVTPETPFDLGVLLWGDVPTVA